VHIDSNGQHFRIAINVKSQASPSELLFLVKDNFRHPITSNLGNLPSGVTLLESKPGTQALDYIRRQSLQSLE
jgi:uncharacterized protein YukJ